MRPLVSALGEGTSGGVFFFFVYHPCPFWRAYSQYIVMISLQGTRSELGGGEMVKGGNDGVCLILCFLFYILGMHEVLIYALRILTKYIFTLTGN